MDDDDAAADEWLWPEACGELRELEATLRCLICGDMFHGPVILPCSHTFCSECVRRFLQSKGPINGCCPECKRPCAPRDLVPNRALEKITLLFQRLKPSLLPVLVTNETALRQSKIAAAATAQRMTSKRHKPGVTPDKMPLLSYNVMKDKEIKKLLESIGIKSQIKSRDEIIQIHKEYVLLVNAQADSTNPKSTQQIRDEVMKNHRARQQHSGRRSLDSSVPTPGVADQMRANFERLKQEIAARKAKLTNDAPGSEKSKSDRSFNHSTSTCPGGTWRHVHALRTNQEFFIHTVTHEIRLEPPDEYLEQQKQERIAPDDAATVAESSQRTQSTDPAQPTQQSCAPSSTAVVDVDNEDEDFMIIASPTPRPHKKAVTPPSRSASNRRQATPSKSLTPTPSPGRQRGRKPPRSQPSPSARGRLKSISQDSTSIAESMTPTVFCQTTPVNVDDEAATQFSGGSSGDVVILDEKWECPRCTLVNEPGQDDCEACGHSHRPVRKKQRIQFQRKISSLL